MKENDYYGYGWCYRFLGLSWFFYYEKQKFSFGLKIRFNFFNINLWLGPILVIASVEKL